MTTFRVPAWFALILLGVSGAYAAEGFPGRPQYPDVEIIELQDLYNQFDKVAIIDVRSEYEYETLRIKNAINIPVAHTSFSKDIRNIRSVTNKPLVFYCNGHSCMKSYKAARKAKLAKVPSCYAFDAGVFDWAKTYPKDTVLLGKELRDANRLISGKKFTAHQLGPKEFAKRVGPSTMVIDVRDSYQRAAVGLFPFEEKWIPLSQKGRLSDHIDRAKRNGKTLLIYDEVGKQVRWLQYRLEQAGVKKYYFMKGGASAYIDSI